MKSSHQPKNLSWQLLLLLLMAAFVVPACSIISEPEDEQAAYDGAPVVSIAAPLANDSYYEGVSVNIVARVENAGPDVARVIITLDGQIIGEQALPNSSGAPSFIVTNGWTASGVGTHTIGVVASRNDGTPSNPANVSINVVAALATNQSAGDTSAPTQVPTADTAQGQPTNAPANTQAPANTTAPTDVPAPTNSPEPTDVPATNTPSKPQARVTTGANIRRGPGTNFEPPIGSLATGATADILAISPDSQWYKITYYNGDGWIFANTVEVVGDTSNIPRDAGPPTPVPFTATPVATNTPTAVADLSITAASTSPFPFVCGRDSEIRVTVTNSGTGNSGETRVVVEDLFNGSVGANTEAPVRGLAPGESVTVTMYLRVNTNIDEGHISRVRVDPDNRVAETNESNNTDEDPYVLATGSC